MRYILSLDQGTTSSRAIAFNAQGRIAHVAQRAFEQHFPADGWVEHNAEEIWTSQLAVAREVVNRVGVDAIAAIGVTNQRETTIVWDRATGEPICPAIVWQDRRTAPFCEQLIADGHAEWITERTGLVVDAYFSGTKLRWILDHVDGARTRAERGELAFGTVDTWLIYNLTGGAVHATDASNASRTLLYDIERGEFTDELLELLNIPAAVLPQVRDSSGDFGVTERALFGAPVPITGVAGDQQAALFGQCCWSPGMAKNTYGTGCFMLSHTGAQRVLSRNRLLTTVAWQIDGRREFALEGSVFMGGATVQWLRDGLGLIEDAADIEALAQQVPDPDGVLMVPAFTGLGAPHWDPYARGTLLGLSRGTTSAHIARAALEGIAMQCADVMDAIVRDADRPLSELRVDGGASRNALMMQHQADVLGTTVVRAGVTETTALGAAYLAGLAIGFWSNRDVIAKQWDAAAAYQPKINDAARDRLRRRWADGVARAGGWQTAP